MKSDSVTKRVARYVVDTDGRDIPEVAFNAARQCLVDYVGVCVAALSTAESRIMRGVIDRWRSTGGASLFGGGTAAPVAAALYNGTLSHCLDSDDTHIPSVIHISGPLWAGLLGVGADRGFNELRMLRAFVSGFEVAARLGDGGIGVRLNQGGWHATPTLGGFGTAAGVSALLGLNESQVAHSLALCATQACGLASSFGSMAKPMHSGKASMDGVMAVELAEAGYTGMPDPLDASGRFLETFLQDKSAQFALSPFDQVWEITRNSFKPYAACQLSHAAIDAAQRARPRVGNRRVERIVAYVHPLAIRIATVIDPKTPTEGKFCVGFCVALALAGYPMTNADFCEERLHDASLLDVTSRFKMREEAGMERTATRLEIALDDGDTVIEYVADAFGSAGNPMDWAALDRKFMGSVEPVLGGRAADLLDVLHHFEKPGALEEIFLIARPTDPTSTIAARA